MNNEAIIQALLQGLKVFVVAGLTALSADLSGLVAIGTANDPLTGPLILSIISAVIVAILKAIGGPTTPAPVTHGRAAGESAAPRPNILAV